MNDTATPAVKHAPGWVEHAVSALNAWLGDHLARTDNGLQQPMAFYRDNHPLAPEALPAPLSGKVCVLVHGLGCNESLWAFSPQEACGGYGELLAQRCGYTPLYLRFNTGLRISDNGRQLAALLERYVQQHGEAVTEFVLIGHSMGGLVLRSACHLGGLAGHSWVPRVRQVIYLGAPHLGAPLEKATHLVTHVLDLFDTTATEVIRDVLNSRSAGVKDLRYGSLLEQDVLDCDPDALLENRQVMVPWLATARHHRVVGRLPGIAAVLGDAVVPAGSAAGHGSQSGISDTGDVVVLPGLSHLALAHHSRVYDHIERWVTTHG